MKLQQQLWNSRFSLDPVPNPVAFFFLRLNSRECQVLDEGAPRNSRIWERLEGAGIVGLGFALPCNFPKIAIFSQFGTH